MHITGFGFEDLLTFGQIEELIDLVPNNAIQLWGEIEPRKLSDETKTGIWLEFYQDGLPKVNFFEREREDRPYDADAQAIKFAAGGVYDRIYFREAGLNRFRGHAVTIAGLKRCLIHWLKSDYVGNLKFLVSNSELSDSDASTCIRISICYGPKSLNKHFPKQGIYFTAGAKVKDWPENEKGILATFENRARQLGFLTEFPQPAIVR